MFKITQYDGPSHEFATVAEYREFLMTTKEPLIHLEEHLPDQIDGHPPTLLRQEIDEMWERLYEKME